MKVYHIIIDGQGPLIVARESEAGKSILQKMMNAKSSSCLRQMTVAIDEDVPTIGAAICNPRDNFSRKIGRAKAIGMLQKALVHNWTSCGLKGLEDELSIHEGKFRLALAEFVDRIEANRNNKGE